MTERNGKRFHSRAHDDEDYTRTSRRPLEELVIELSGARVTGEAGKRRAAGRVRVEHRPVEGPPSHNDWRSFESPLDLAELDELRWYLETYWGWAYGPSRGRAKTLETKLEPWGRALYDATLAHAPELVAAWRDDARVARRIAVQVDAADAAAGELLALPWELLADADGHLFEGDLETRVVRRLPSHTLPDQLPPQAALRVLLVIARPEGPGIPLTDPRASAGILGEALAPLGHVTTLDVLADGTFPALIETLARAAEHNRPFSIVHFDGHRVFDQDRGVGQLCFEDPTDVADGKLKRRSELIVGGVLGDKLRDYRLPLIVMEACQADPQVTHVVAAKLLRAGVGSVVATSHSVLVETRRRFVARFYRSLVEGRSVGGAMVDAQRILCRNDLRGEVGGHGELRLRDWYAPVLYQEEGADLPLLRDSADDLPDPAAADRDAYDTDTYDADAYDTDAYDSEPPDSQPLKSMHQFCSDALPDPPEHGFFGRTRELLTIQRRLRDQRVLALTGGSGQGKTALAAEAARWLLDIQRSERVAFVCVDGLLPDARAVLDGVGRQLVPGYTVANEEGSGSERDKLLRARRPIEIALLENRTLLVIDDLESVLPPSGKEVTADLETLLEMLAELAAVGENTRVIVTSREAPPAALGAEEIQVGPLSPSEGRELLAAALTRRDERPADESEPGELAEALAETVGGHPRSVMLLASAVAERGLASTREAVTQAMQRLETRYTNEQERALLASVGLSLERLPAETRRKLRSLTVFRAMAPLPAMAFMLEVELAEALELCRELVALGLAEASGPYLLPAPGLGPALASELTGDEREALEARWLEAMLGLSHFMYRQLAFEDAHSAITGARVALPELLATLSAAESRANAGSLAAEQALGFVGRLEQLVVYMGRPAVLAHVAAAHERLHVLANS